MGTPQTQPWDAAAHLRTEEDIVAYLDAVLAESDPELILAALRDVARAKGKAAGAGDPGLLPEATSNNDPGLGSVFRVLDALGLRLHVTHASRT